MGLSAHRRTRAGIASAPRIFSAERRKRNWTPRRSAASGGSVGHREPSLIHGHFSDRFDRLHRRAHRRNSPRSPYGSAESAGERENGTVGEQTPLARAAIASGIYSGPGR